MEKLDNIINKIKEFFEKFNDISFLNKTPSKAFLITAFVIIITVTGIFSAVTVIKEDKEKEAQTTSVDGTVETQEATSRIYSQELLGNFLLVLTQDGNEKIQLLSLARLDSENKRVSISFVEPSVTSDVNGFKGTMQEHLNHGGINELVWAMGEYASISIEGYIFGDEQNFIDLMKSLGDMEVSVDEKINYTHRGIPIIIEKGKQKLSADMMLKYFVYLCKNYDKMPDKLIETMIIYGKKMFDSSEDSVIDSSFSKMIRHFTTDISVVDFTNYRDAVKTLASSDNLVEIMIETDASKLKNNP